MLATSVARRLRGEWTAEPKLDGWRAIVTVDPSLPQGFDVCSRNGRSLTTSVPELRGMAHVGVRTVLDGEWSPWTETTSTSMHSAGE
jgi:ATP-dependent DNA ligase